MPRTVQVQQHKPSFGRTKMQVARTEEVVILSMPAKGRKEHPHCHRAKRVEVSIGFTIDCLAFTYSKPMVG